LINEINYVIFALSDYMDSRLAYIESIHYRDKLMIHWLTE